VTLVAPTPQEAYELAKRKYGESFALISARQIAQSGSDTISCEITVSIAKERFLDIKGDEDEEELMGELMILREQIMQMRNNLLSSQPLEVESKKSDTLTKVHNFFAQKGLESGWLDGVLSPLVGTPIEEDEALLHSYLMEEIDEQLIIQEEQLRGFKIKMFVGATGVGKSTTVAKLAARYTAMPGVNLKVALVNLDSFKIGAFEQLSRHASMLNLDHFGVTTIEDFALLVPSLGEYDIVLVDTAGMSPYDTRKLVRTVEYLSVDTPCEIEITLVLPVGLKHEDLETTFETFSFLNLHSVILSKFDETRHIGGVVSYLMSHPLPLSYFTIGQNVPDDIIQANKEYLIGSLLGKGYEG